MSCPRQERPHFETGPLTRSFLVARAGASRAAWPGPADPAENRLEAKRLRDLGVAGDRSRRLWRGDRRLSPRLCALSVAQPLVQPGGRARSPGIVEPKPSTRSRHSRGCAQRRAARPVSTAAAARGRVRAELARLELVVAPADAEVAMGGHPIPASRRRRLPVAAGARPIAVHEMVLNATPACLPVEPGEALRDRLGACRRRSQAKRETMPQPRPNLLEPARGAGCARADACYQLIVALGGAGAGPAGINLVGRAGLAKAEQRRPPSKSAEVPALDPPPA